MIVEQRISRIHGLVRRGRHSSTWPLTDDEAHVLKLLDQKIEAVRVGRQGLDVILSEFGEADAETD